MTKREFATFILDPRTRVDPDVLDSDGLQETSSILEEFCVDHCATMKACDRRSVAENSVSVDNSEKSLVAREQRDEPPKKRKISLGLHSSHRSVSSSERQSTKIIVLEESLKQLDTQASGIEVESLNQK